MKKRDIVLTIICLFMFIYTSVWVHVYLRSRAECLRGVELEAKIAESYLPYAKIIPRKQGGLLAEGEAEQFDKAQYDYYQSVTKVITALDNCLHAYTPFNKYLPRAAEALYGLGYDCFNKNEFHLALSAYRTIRISPDPEWVAKADEMIKQTYTKMELLKSRKMKGKTKR